MATSEVIEEARAKEQTGASVVPTWGQIAGAILVLAFIAVAFEAFAGPGLRLRTFGTLLSGSAQSPP